MSTLRFGSIVSVLVAFSALGAAACSGKSKAQNGSGGAGASAAGGAGGTTGGAGGSSSGGASGKGGATGGSSGAGSGGTTGGTSGNGGTAGSGGSAAGQGGAGGGTGGASGSGAAAGEGGEGGQMNDDRPILARPVREELTCDVMTPLHDLEFEWAEGDLVSTTSDVFLVWGRPSETSMPDAIVRAPLDSTGALGSTLPIATYQGSYSSRPRAVVSPRGISVAWAEAGANEMSAMRIAELDATGAVSKAAVTVSGLSERLNDVAVAPTASGNALLFVNTSVDYSSSRVRFALLDADGALTGNVTDIETVGSGATPQAGAVVALPNGFAVTHTLAGLEAETYLTFLAADGTVQGDSILLGTGRPYLGQSLLVRGGELIVAFGDEDGGYENADIAGFIALARFDIATRTRNGSVVRVQHPTVSEETVNPVLFENGDDIGLMWSRGSVIYICAGCMPDNHLEGVMMDGDDFTPISTLFALPNEEPMGGFIKPMIAPSGATFMVAATLRFHVSGNAAAGTFRCIPVP